MTERNWFNWAALVLGAAVVVGFGVGLGLGVSFSAPPAKAPTASSSSTAAAIDRVYLTVSFNPGTGSDQFYPANFSVASHTLVQVTITNYDNGTNVVAPMYGMVSGTVGETMGVAMAGQSAPTMVDHADLNHIAHTFTISSAPYRLNVPVPSATSLSAPTVVTFAAYFNATGTFAWVCMAPCDPSAMQAVGFMSGAVTITG